MSEPRTQAGRDLLEMFARQWPDATYATVDDMSDAILATEREAVAQALTPERLARALGSHLELQAAIGRRVNPPVLHRCTSYCALAIFDALRDESGVASSPEPVTSVRPRSTDDAAPRGGADVT